MGKCITIFRHKAGEHSSKLLPFVASFNGATVVRGTLTFNENCWYERPATGAEDYNKAFGVKKPVWNLSAHVESCMFAWRPIYEDVQRKRLTLAPYFHFTDVPKAVTGNEAFYRVGSGTAFATRYELTVETGKPIDFEIRLRRDCYQITFWQQLFPNVEAVRVAITVPKNDPYLHFLGINAWFVGQNKVVRDMSMRLDWELFKDSAFSESLKVDWESLKSKLLPKPFVKMGT